MPLHKGSENMPHIQVSLYPGRDDELKRKMAKELKNTVVEKIGIPIEAISVSIEDIEPDDFEPTIQDRLKNEKNELILESDYIKE